MGGLGSGIRWEKKGVVEGHHRLDVRELHREYGIKPGSQITVQYEWRGKQIAQEVHIDWSPCTFGGHRPWLICMHCGGRVAVLYLREKYFACRHCHDLTYQSCQESDSRFRKLLQNYDGFGVGENMPLYALKGWLSRAQREKDRLKRKMAQQKKRRGRPKKVHGSQGKLH